jgi:uncharacterized membrane protein SpoIIM required for sporulation
MIESQFISENRKTWHELEMAMYNNDVDPDKMSQLFRKVSGDLSYAQTHFPRRRVNVYLNGLVSQMFDKMQTKPKYNFLQNIKRFYTDVLPNEMVRSYKPMLISFLVFVTCIIIGAVTTLQDQSFAEEILGKQYVKITETNIDSGDPMAIYKSREQLDMFIGITLNNILVAARCFLMGIFAGIGTLVMLIYNGVMVGVFQAMFYHKGLLMTAFLTIWIHGTIEISAIILAGGAGLMLGSALLFPRTFTRIQSLKLGASRALTIILSTIPLFVIAGFIEGFITRLTSMPTMMKVLIIAMSAGGLIWIYVVLPYLYYRSGKYDPMKNLQVGSLFYNDTFDSRDDFFRMTFKTYGLYFGSWVKYFFIPVLFIISIIYYLSVISIGTMEETEKIRIISGGFPLAVFWVLIFTYFFCIMHLMIQRAAISLASVVDNFRAYLFAYVISALLIVVPFYIIPVPYLYFAYLVFPTCMVFFVNHYLNEESTNMEAIRNGLTRGYTHWVSVMVISIIAAALFFLCYLIMQIIYTQIFSTLVSWHLIFESTYHKDLFFLHFLMCSVCFLVLPIFYFLIHYRVLAITKISESWDLVDGIERFGSSSKTVHFEK